MKDRVEERLLFWLDITYEFYMSRIEAALQQLGASALSLRPTNRLSVTLVVIYGTSSR